MITELQFGQWLPDQADYQNPGLIEANNVYPTNAGYGPFAGAALTSATTAQPILSAEMFFDINNNTVVAAGGATALYVKRASTVTETTGLTTTDNWRFERFNGIVVAVSRENVPQYLADVNATNTWAALPGSPPQAAQVGRVGDFLVMGDMVDVAETGNEDAPYRLRWSAFNNPTAAWVTDRGELSGYRDLDPRYGRITAIVGGRFGLVFQERAIWRMTFVGAPAVFELSEVSVDRGCIASASAVTIGAVTYFLSQDGFQRTDGSSLDAVGGNRVNRHFLSQVNQTQIKKTHGAINWTQASIVWGYYPSGQEAFAEQIVYNFIEDKWSSATETVDYFVRSRVDGLTLSDVAAIYSSLGDAGSIPVGNEEWLPRDLSFAAFVPSDGGSAFAEMSGPAREAQLVTGFAQIEPGRRSRVTGVWPVVASSGADMATKIRTRDRQGAGIRTTGDTTPGADGFCPHNVDGWLHSVRTTIPANTDWTNAQGVQVRVARTGRR